MLAREDPRVREYVLKLVAPNIGNDLAAAVEAAWNLGITDATTTSTAVPSYLDGDWHRGWGALERLDPLEPQAHPAVVTTDLRRQWGWSRTGSIRLEPTKE